MNINRTLFEAVKPYLYIYDCLDNDLRPFLLQRKPFLNRQKKAIQIIEGIMTLHGKEKLLKYLTKLAKIEHGIGQLEPWVRDHVVHALLSFILGIYINEKLLRPLGTGVDAFQWQLAGLFHDVGYPVQIAKDILGPFSETINSIKRRLEIHASDVHLNIVPVGLDSLQNGQNSFDLIQRCLDGWGLKIDAKKEYEDKMTSSEICHGMISSLAVLYVIDLMYQKYNPGREYKDIYAVSNNINWNQICFDRDIITACSAIYIHNLPLRCFRNAKIDVTKAPLAFLLKLADCLQEWERPSQKNQDGLSATLFDICTKNGELIFSADIQERTRNNIKREISFCLVNSYTKVV
jgi:hypothetical protein